jgi:hypothetical protein
VPGPVECASANHDHNGSGSLRGDVILVTGNLRAGTPKTFVPRIQRAFDGGRMAERVVIGRLNQDGMLACLLSDMQRAHPCFITELRSVGRNSGSGHGMGRNRSFGLQHYTAKAGEQGCAHMQTEKPIQLL